MLYFLYVIDTISPTVVGALGLGNMAILTWRRYIRGRGRQVPSMRAISRAVRFYLPLALSLLIIAGFVAFVGWSAIVAWQQFQRPLHDDGALTSRVSINGVIIAGMLTALIVQVRNIKRGIPPLM